MRFDSMIAKFWPFSFRTPEEAVLQDVADLMKTWGKAAYSVASTLSMREDVGLVEADAPGHWAQVKREIGLRTGIEDTDPDDECDSAAIHIVM